MSYVSDLIHDIEQYGAMVVSQARDAAYHDELESNRHTQHQGSVRINGVDIPAKVVQQLREQGISLEHYNEGELRDAILACAHDSRLIDDHNGAHFRDKLVKDAHEEHEELYDDDHDIMTYRKNSGHISNMRSSGKKDGSLWVDRVGGISESAQSFCERLRIQEEEDLRRSKEDEQQPRHSAG